MTGPLPDFREHGRDTKFVPLTRADIGSPVIGIERYVAFLEHWLDRPLAGLRILDIGCGRGELVGALRHRGARAFGLEIEPRFVKSGEVLETLYNDSHPILSLADGTGRSSFPDAFFDVVISNQVIEHVAELDRMMAEVARVLVAGGRTCHLFPARHRIVEPHFHMPLVHWLPKTSVRHVAVRVMLALGFARPYYAGRPARERAEIICRYSLEQTYYRSIGSIETCMVRNGLDPRRAEGMQCYLASRFGDGVYSRRVAGALFSTFRAVMLCAVKQGPSR